MRHRTLLVLLMTGLMAACGGTASPTATPSSGGGGGSGTTNPTAAPPTQAGGPGTQGSAPSACALLTAADAATALGAAVDQPTVNQGGGNSNNCTYAPTVITGLMSIELNVLTLNAFSQVKSHVGQGMTLIPASGLGDDAFYIDAGFAGTTLYVSSGTIAISVTMLNGNDSAAQIQAAEKVAVQTALGRL